MVDADRGAARTRRPAVVLPWPLAVAALLAQARRAIAGHRRLSTWVMVTSNPTDARCILWLHFWDRHRPRTSTAVCPVSVTGPARVSAGCKFPVGLRHSSGPAHHLASLVRCNASTDGRC